MTEITQQCARRLAVATLEMAVDDWRRYQLTTCWPGRIGRLGRGGYPRAGFNSPRDELIDFFNGTLCAEMLGVLNIPVETFKERLGIP